LEEQSRRAWEKILELSHQIGIKVEGGSIRRTSSRFCLGVEHGDYNGTELFGVSTDRFIWMAYKRSGTKRVRLFSANYPKDGIIEFTLGDVPPPKSEGIAGTWVRFPFGVDYILRREGYRLEKGIDGIIYGNIPGGGMSRSASLTLNLIVTFLAANGLEIDDKFKIVDMAQAVENDYIGSPCGQLDQIMILFGKKNLGTHFNPKDRTVSYLPFGSESDFCLVSLDTGTDRPGLEKSTYKIRQAECEEFVSILKPKFGVSTLGDIKDEETFRWIEEEYKEKYPDLFDRLNYIYHAQKRFYRMLDAWKQGNIPTVGEIFREDGLDLRDMYKISGPELETMCDIARTVPGVYGERMLGGGDKGAAGALVDAKSTEALRQAVDLAFPRSYPWLKDKYAVHVCRSVDGMKLIQPV
jgi:galactokinase